MRNLQRHLQLIYESDGSQGGNGTRCDVQQLLELDTQFILHGLDSLRTISIRIPSGGATPCPAARKGVIDTRTLTVVMVVEFIDLSDVLDRKLRATPRPAG